MSYRARAFGRGALQGGAAGATTGSPYGVLIGALAGGGLGLLGAKEDEKTRRMIETANKLSLMQTGQELTMGRMNIRQARLIEDEERKQRRTKQNVGRMLGAYFKALPR